MRSLVLTEEQRAILDSVNRAKRGEQHELEGDVDKLYRLVDVLTEDLYLEQSRVSELEAALRELVEQCETDFCSSATECGECPSEDSEAVAAGFDGDCAVTFGAIRRGRAALKDSP